MAAGDKMSPEPAALAAPEAWDPLHQGSPADAFWTTSNVGEAIPGIPTPLSASLWKDGPGRALLEAAWSVGALRRSEVTDEAAKGLFGFFYGRASMRVEILALLGDRMPGTSGREVVLGVCGRVPEDMTFRPTRERYLTVATRLPRSFAGVPRKLHSFTSATDTWWKESVERVQALDLPAAVALLRDADVRFVEAVVLQGCTTLGSVGPINDALARAIAAAEEPGLSVLLSPIGGAEMAVVSDLWAASRGVITVADVIRRHGFHGPNEGEASSRIWREDASPVVTVVDQYRSRDDSHDPAVREEKLRYERDRAEARLLAATPRLQRAGVSLLLRLARTRLPHRGYAKRSLLQSLDVARASARRIGDLLADAGTIAKPDDVFFLTKGELYSGAPAGADDLVARRRERRDTYLQFNIPNNWQGTPPALPAEAASPHSAPAASPDSPRSDVTGIGVSAGVVEGVCRVVLDPDFGDVEPDEILVAPTTDPSWSSIMFISAGLVVDIGGALSHAAVVARELGIPCVVNTRNGSSVLRTGDRIRVDGTTGVVSRLTPAG